MNYLMHVGFVWEICPLKPFRIGEFTRFYPEWLDFLGNILFCWIFSLEIDHQSSQMSYRPALFKILEQDRCDVCNRFSPKLTHKGGVCDELVKEI